MTAPLDEDLVQRVNDVGSSTWSGVCYRHVAGRRDPLSGVGARLMGGRWNQPGVSAVYLAHPIGTCLAELDRLAEAQGVTASDLLRATPGRTLSTIRVDQLDVLDLRDPQVCAKVGLELEDITDDDRTACQAVSQAADFLQFGGVLAPSAAGHGLVLAVFEARVAPGQMSIELTEPLTETRYHELSPQYSRSASGS